MDSDYHFDFPSDHPDLTLSAADIEAIGSGFTSPLPSIPLALPLTADIQQHDDGPGQGDIEQVRVDDDHNHDPFGIHAEGFHTTGEGVEEQYGEGVGEGSLGDIENTALLAGEGDNLGGIVENGAGDGDDAGESSGGRRTNIDVSEISEEEKKRRMRDSNRKAAEKSRAKKRRMQGNFEVQITELRKENDRLRARLQILRPGIPLVPFPSLSTIDPSLSHLTGEDPSQIAGPSSSSFSADSKTNDIGIDRAYFSKLSGELEAAKFALWEKHNELAKLRGISTTTTTGPSEAILEKRRELLGRHNGLLVPRAEEAAMNAVLVLLEEETVQLGDRRKAINEELVRRGVAVHDEDDEAGGMVGVGDVAPGTGAGTGMERDISTEDQDTRTRVLAQAVRDAALGGVVSTVENPESGAPAAMIPLAPGESDDINLDREDEYDIQPYIEEAVKNWQHENPHADDLVL